jgi:hypothetical protein
MSGLLPALARRFAAKWLRPFDPRCEARNS